MTGQSSAHGAKSQTAAGGADGALVQRPGYVALWPKADIRKVGLDVRCGPEAGMAPVISSSTAALRLRACAQ